jgi:hypothetical protein
MNSIDAKALSGGLDPALDLMDPNYPRDDPNYRESVSMWIFDDDNRIQLPRFLLDDIPLDTTRRSLFLNIAFPDGRAVVHSGLGERGSMVDSSGKPTIYAGGGLTFQVIEPWIRWRATYRGTMFDTRSEQLLRPNPEGTSVDVELSVEMTSAVPPWIPGDMAYNGKSLMDGKSIESRFMGHGFRYEQLVLAEGSCRIGKREFPISGRGLRIHRRSSRNVSGFWGHAWQSAVFPSGRGFGYTAFPPRDGVESFMEGYYYDGEQMLPARIHKIPWMTSATPRGEDVGLQIETANGIVNIAGQTIATTFKNRAVGDSGSTWPDNLLLQQGCARYRLHDEAAFGMIERSNFRANLNAMAVRS